MQFVGLYALHEGVEVDPMKTATLQDWSTPRIAKDMQHFHYRLVSYYRSCIPKFASVATPLTGLTKKGAKLA